MAICAVAGRAKPRMQSTSRGSTRRTGNDLRRLGILPGTLYGVPVRTAQQWSGPAGPPGSRMGPHGPTISGGEPCLPGAPRPGYVAGPPQQMTRTSREDAMSLREKAEIVDADGLRRIVTRIAHEI